MRADVRPVIQRYRPVPLALEDKIEEKVQELLKLGIIERVPEGSPPEWISPVVPVQKKNGEMRLCIDLRRVNEAVIRSRYPLPAPNYLLSTIEPSVKFSLIDFTDAFFHFELDEASRNLTAFITKSGLYRFTRLTMGLKCAPEEFTKGMHLVVLIDLEGIHDYMDDILVVGRTDEEHDRNLDHLLRRLKQFGIRISEKSKLGVREVVFLGHRINSQGIWPTKDKMETLSRFKAPTTKDEVKSFLGFITFLSKFIPNLAHETYSLRQLTKKSVNFQWAQAQEEAFCRIKSLISDKSHLKFFESGRKTRLITDASPVGVGAILMQLHGDTWRPVAYSSKGLTACEQRYGQTEREALGFVNGIESFHYFLYGIHFQVVTDCKVLKLLFGSKSDVNARILRWVLRLSIYDFEVEYIPGNDNFADALSRLVEFRDISETGGEKILRAALASTVPRAMSIEEIEKATASDEEMVKIMEAVMSEDWSEVSTEYAPFRREICAVGGVLMKGEKMIIPRSLEQQVLDLAHQGHPGQARMKMRLRKKVWFPRLESKVARFVGSCKGCIMVAMPDCPPPMNPKTFPDYPYEDVVMDYKQVGAEMLLVIIDYYSRYAYYEIVRPATAVETAIALQKVFGLFGIPKTIQCDNGAHFQGDVIELCKRLEITLLRSAPRYPQANGQVERFNREIKNVVKTATGLNLNWKAELAKFLLMYHVTPHPALAGRTPSEAMFSRNIRDVLPDFADRKPTDDDVMRDANNVYKYKSKAYTDKARGAKPSLLEPGDVVMMKNESMRGTEPNFGPEEFQIVDMSGQGVEIQAVDDPERRFKRHPTHLKRLPTNEIEQDVQDQVRQQRNRQAPKKLNDYVLYWTKQGTTDGDDF